jgi:hypothetical protein
VWEGWKAGFLAFHAFHTPAFPWLFWQIAFFSFYSGQHSPINSMVFYRQVILTEPSDTLNLWTSPVTVTTMQYSVFPHNSVSREKEQLLCALYGTRNLNVRVTVET